MLSLIKNKYHLPLSILHGDVRRLLLEDGVTNIVHWGSAMHCILDTKRAMEEVYRVLKPGRKLCTTTVLRPFLDVVFRFFDLIEIWNALPMGQALVLMKRVVS